MTLEEKQATAIHAAWTTAKQIAVENGIPEDQAAAEYLSYAITELWNGEEPEAYKTAICKLVTDLLDGYFHSIGVTGGAA